MGSEETLGRWFAQGDGRRDAIVLATKVYKEFLKEGLRPEPNRQSPAIGAVKIRRQVESSLHRLQTDVIDLYQMHHIDRECPLGGDLAGLRYAGETGQDPLCRLL